MLKIDCIIGEVVSGFVRTEYLLSQIATELGHNEYRTDFFADGRTSIKINQLIKFISLSDIVKKPNYIALLEEFDSLREERNMIVHSLVLTNVSDKNEFMFHNYLKTKDGMLNKSKHYNMSDLDEIKERIMEVHNGLVTLHFQ